MENFYYGLKNRDLNIYQLESWQEYFLIHSLDGIVNKWIDGLYIEK